MDTKLRKLFNSAFIEQIKYMRYLGFECNKEGLNYKNLVDAWVEFNYEGEVPFEDEVNIDAIKEAKRPKRTKSYTENLFKDSEKVRLSEIWKFNSYKRESFVDCRRNEDEELGLGINVTLHPNVYTAYKYGHLSKKADRCLPKKFEEYVKVVRRLASWIDFCTERELSHEQGALEFYLMEKEFSVIFLSEFLVALTKDGEAEYNENNVRETLLELGAIYFTPLVQTWEYFVALYSEDLLEILTSKYATSLYTWTMLAPFSRLGEEQQQLLNTFNKELIVVDRNKILRSIKILEELSEDKNRLEKINMWFKEFQNTKEKIFEYFYISSELSKFEQTLIDEQKKQTEHDKFTQLKLEEMILVNKKDASEMMQKYRYLQIFSGKRVKKKISIIEDARVEWYDESISSLIEELGNITNP